jgi:hypothetical protein
VPAGLVPLALVVTLSPLSVIPAVLALPAVRPRPAGLASWRGGWCGGPSSRLRSSGCPTLLGGDLDRPRPWASWLRITLGLALIVVGVWRWLTRHHFAIARLAGHDQHHHPGTGRRCRGTAGGHRDRGLVDIKRDPVTGPSGLPQHPPQRRRAGCAGRRRDHRAGHIGAALGGLEPVPCNHCVAENHPRVSHSETTAPGISAAVVAAGRAVSPAPRYVAQCAAIALTRA